MRRRIIIENITTIEELKNLIDNGSRFIVMQYCISIVARTFRLYSPAYLVEKDQRLTKYKITYNLLTIFFGWWGLPWGPIHSIRSIYINRSGGVDVTEDIMLNINETSLNENMVELKLTNQLFCKPDRLDSKSFKKAILPEFENDYNIRLLVVALFINTEGTPFYTIGLKLTKNYEEYVEKIRKSLYKKFSRNSHF
jgi:hypothetical protein